MLSELDEALAAEGRTRADIAVSASPYFRPLEPGDVEAYAAAGVDRLIVMCLAFGPDDLLPTLDTLAEEVLQPARG